MNSSALPQIIGNLCAGLATLLFLFPLQNRIGEFARKHLSSDEWVAPVLFILVPLWLLLMGALLCVAVAGGFDWLRLGRTTLYILAAAAAVALAVVTFVFIGLYIRPGFTPRFLYLPVICLVPLATVLLVLVSLNQKLVPGFPTQWLRLPWALFAALSLVVCVVFLGHRIFRMGVGGVMGMVYRIGNPGPSSADLLAKIATLDPEKDFADLLQRANRYQGREVSETATARLRSHPKFLDLLSAELESGYVEPAVTFLSETTLSPAEKTRLARPARAAMERWVNRIPAPNYTTKKHLKDLQRWGTEMFQILPEKFAGTGVDFAPVIEDFKDKVNPTR